MRCKTRLRTCAAGCTSRGGVAVVSNSSPLILFARIGQLELLRRVFDEIILPPVVEREVAGAGGRPGSTEVAAAAWIRRQTLTRPPVDLGIAGSLGAGEAEVISLALELDRVLPVLIDDREGR